VSSRSIETDPFDLLLIYKITSLGGPQLDKALARAVLLKLLAIPQNSSIFNSLLTALA
jgi:hypothetical protein